MESPTLQDNHQLDGCPLHPPVKHNFACAHARLNRLTEAFLRSLTKSCDHLRGVCVRSNHDALASSCNKLEPRARKLLHHLQHPSMHLSSTVQVSPPAFEFSCLYRVFAPRKTWGRVTNWLQKDSFECRFTSKGWLTRTRRHLITRTCSELGFRIARLTFNLVESVYKQPLLSSHSMGEDKNDPAYCFVQKHR